MSVHRAAAEGFERGVAHYRSARPRYHEDLVGRLVDLLAGVVAASTVVEIGAGTGVLTAQLVERGVVPVAIEPVEAMRAALTEALPEVESRPGTAEDLPFDDGSVGGVVVAQAFHWFDHGPAMDEITRVLAPGGLLATIWNVKEGDAPWYRRYMEVIDRHAGDTPRHRDQVWRRAIDGDDRLEPVGEWRVDNTKPVDVDGVVGRALSTSYIAAMAPDAKAEVAAEIRAAVADVPEPIPFPYRGELQVWARGTPST
ncbi:MAG: class I SAM-dependent methyltransferase [Actinomycetota bacterium]